VKLPGRRGEFRRQVDTGEQRRGRGVREVERQQGVDDAVDQLPVREIAQAGDEDTALRLLSEVRQVAAGERLDDRRFVDEVLIERAGRDPCARRDLVRRRGVVALFGDDLLRGIEDGLDATKTSPLALRAGHSRWLIRWHHFDVPDRSLLTYTSIYS